MTLSKLCVNLETSDKAISGHQHQTTLNIQRNLVTDVAQQSTLTNRPVAVPVITSVASVTTSDIFRTFVVVLPENKTINLLPTEEKAEEKTIESHPNGPKRCLKIHLMTC